MPVNDLRIEARFKNNVLWHAIHDVYPSVAAFCRAHGLNQITVGGYLTLTRNPYHAPHWSDRHDDEYTRYCYRGTDRRDLRPSAARLCDVTGIGKDDLFPAALYSGVIPSRRVAEINSAQLAGRIAAGTRVLIPATAEDDVFAAERRQTLDLVLCTLPARQHLALRMRFGLDDGEPCQLADLATALGVSKERARQIEMQALSALRRKTRARRLRPFIEAEAV